MARTTVEKSQGLAIRSRERAHGIRGHQSLKSICHVFSERKKTDRYSWRRLRRRGRGHAIWAGNLGADHDVILIDRRADHVFMPAFLFVMIGERQPRDISRSLKHLEKRNVKVIQSEILGIDPFGRKFRWKKKRLVTIT